MWEGVDVCCDQLFDGCGGDVLIMELVVIVQGCYVFIWVWIWCIECVVQVCDVIFVEVFVFGEFEYVEVFVIVVVVIKCGE